MIRSATFCSCGVCGVEGAYNHAVPLWNGAPCLTTMPNDGYRVVCVTCHDAWAKWDDQYMNAPRPVPYFRPPHRQNDESLASIAHS